MKFDFWVIFLLHLLTVDGLFNLTILHTNDFHARYEETNSFSGKCSDPGSCFGGSARIKAKVDEIRAQIPNTIFLDGGDQYQGTIWFYHYGGRVAAHFMNLLGYDVMALGNHEFDRGVAELVPFLDNVSFPVVSSNINTTREPNIQGKFVSRTILTVGGESIGIVGYTTSTTKVISSPDDLEFMDELTSVEAEVAALEAEGVNKIIALGHAGFGEDKRIAAEVKGLDVVVGGHTNTFLYTGEAPSDEIPQGEYPYVVTQSDGAKVLCVQDYAYGKYLGFLQLGFDDNGVVTQYGGNPILLNNSVAQDPGIKLEVEEWSKELVDIQNNVIGRALVFLDGRRAVCRTMECNLGNMLTDALVHQNLKHADSVQGLGVFIGLWNGGGVRDSIPKGDITLRHVLDVAPWMNTIDTIKLKGEYLLQALENSVAHYDPIDAPGRFLQVSGLRVTYNLSRPAWERVIKVDIICVNCSIPRFVPLDINEMYPIILPSFIRNGGDHYSMIKDHAVMDHVVGDLDSDVIAEYITNMSPIYTGLDGRIKFDNSTPEPVNCPEPTPSTNAHVTSTPALPTNKATTKASTPCIQITDVECPVCPDLQEQLAMINELNKAKESQLSTIASLQTNNDELTKAKEKQYTTIVALAVVCAFLGTMLIIVCLYAFRHSLSRPSRNYKFNNQQYANDAYQEEQTSLEY